MYCSSAVLCVLRSTGVYVGYVIYLTIALNNGCAVVVLYCVYYYAVLVYVGYVIYLTIALNNGCAVVVL